MKRKWLYIICRILNWVLPILMLVNLGNGSSPFLESFGFYVFFMYIVYAVTRFFLEFTRSRWFYEIWIFIFAGGAIYALISNDFWFMNLIIVGFGRSMDGIDITFSDKAVCIAFCVFVMLSKIITLIYQTEEYREGEDERQENLLNAHIENAATEREFRAAIHAKERWKREKEKLEKLKKEGHHRE